MRLMVHRGPNDGSFCMRVWIRPALISQEMSANWNLEVGLGAICVPTSYAPA